MFCVSAVLFATPLSAQPALLPLPAALTPQEGVLTIDRTFTVARPQLSDPRLLAGIARALERIELATGLLLSRELGELGQLKLDVQRAGQAVQTPEEDESYTLEVARDGVQLKAATTVGALRGLETLLQLIQSGPAGPALPLLRIEDRPRFRWRGLLLDVSRHFQPPEVIERTLDGMALVKLNVFHWHLSDDQGFRVESLRFPKLHRLASDGRYYTQAQVRALVAHARARGIRVVPEFDMPGHATSWLTAHPEYASLPGPYSLERRFGIFDPSFDPTRPDTYRFLDAFIAEMKSLFPDPYWHVGGDEVTGKHWDQNPRIRAWKEQRGWDNQRLQAYFNERVGALLHKHGRRMVGWDEILHDSLATDAVIQSWRGKEQFKSSLARGHAAILSAPYYLDRMAPIEDYYLADPESDSELALGGEACQWGEQIDEQNVDSRLWPRLAAIAERLWSPREQRDTADLMRRLWPVSLQLERLGLSHLQHSSRTLRQLTGSDKLRPLLELLRYTEPLGLLERAALEPATQLTPLRRLADAANLDPWQRVELEQLAQQTRAGSQAARRRLEWHIRRWRVLAAELEGQLILQPLAAEGLAAARALGRLAELATDILARRDTARVAAELDELAKPQGLLRLTPIRAMRSLLE